MATDQPSQPQPPAAQGAMAEDGLDEIPAARGREPAVPAYEW